MVSLDRTFQSPSSIQSLYVHHGWGGWATVKAGTQERGTEIRCKCAGKKMQKWWMRMRTLWRRTWLYRYVRSPSLLVSSLVYRFRHNSQVFSSVCQFRTLKNGQVWSYRSICDCDSDGDFIQAKNQTRAQVSSPRYSYAYLTELVHVHYVVMYSSLTKSGRLNYIGRSWEFHFAMVTSVPKTKWCTGSSGKTSSDLSKCFSRIGCWAYGR